MQTHLRSENVAGVRSTGRRRAAVWVFTRMAFQNLLRRPARTFMLLLAVALGTAAVFSSFVVARGIEASMAQSFARMGADLIVVPEKAMVNITSALLTVQPTESVLDGHLLDDIAHIKGVSQVAPQTIYRVPVMAGMPECKVNLIAFDPVKDFTVQPWLRDKLPRPMKVGDLIAGGRRLESAGEEIQPCGAAADVYGKLGRSGVGPLDDSLFGTYDTVSALAQGLEGMPARIPNFNRDQLSAVLVRLDFGATPEQVRFAVSQLPGVKVITGASIVTSTRQTMTALLAGMMGFTAVMLLGSLILVSLLFSAIIAERKRELGLLRAIGSRRGDVVNMLMAESSFATGLGGVIGLLLGCGLLLLFQHSLVYYLETLHVEFSWPLPMEIGIAACACALLAVLVGVASAALPAWRATSEEPYVLIQGEGK